MSDDAIGKKIDRDSYMRIWGAPPQDEVAPAPVSQQVPEAGEVGEAATLSLEKGRLNQLSEAVLALRQSVELLTMKTESQHLSIERAINDLAKRIEQIEGPPDPSTLKVYGQD